ncbi:MAG: hypothetical protein ABFD62_15400 [Syntrophaceae bacterium]
MTALSKDKKTESKPGVEVPVPVYRNTKIFAGANACINATGFLVPGADTAGLIFQGVSRQYVDNSLGNDGDLIGLVHRRGLWLMKFAHEISQANVGDNVYLVDDDLVDLAVNVTHLIFAGVIAEYLSATEAFVDIEPAVKQADVAVHVADASGAHAASAISILDAGAHYSAAEATVELALQKLAKTIVIAIPRFTGWTKDGEDQAIAALPALELPVPIVVKRAYVNLGTAPGADKTLALELNGSALLSIAGTDTKGEAEALAIAIAANTDLAVVANETAGGAGANCDLILIAQLDDGE